MWTLSEKKKGGGLPHSDASRGKQRKACVHLIHTTGGRRQGETGGGSRFSHITKPKGAYRYDVTNIVFVSSINQHTLNPDSSEKGCEKEPDILINSLL